jgi:hypothetical protein
MAGRRAIPEPYGKRYPEEAITLRGNWMVTSDWHVPYHDPELIELMVATANRFHVENLAIVGDFFDLKWLSHFDIKDLEGSLRDDLAIGIQMLNELLHDFKRVFWSMGNHEYRIFRALKWMLNLPDLAAMLVDNKRLVATQLTHAVLKSGGREYRLTHPKSYSRKAADVAVQLAEKFHCNVLSAHGHLMGTRISVSGEYVGADLGGMFDMERQEYLYLEGDTTHPVWNSGFAMVKDGYLYAFPKTKTDWEFWLNEEKVA